MILVLKPGSTEEQRRELIREIENGLKVHVSVGEETTIIGLVGDVSELIHTPFLPMRSWPIP